MVIIFKICFLFKGGFKMNITFNGSPIKLVGNPVNVGDDAPNFLVTDNNLKN